MIVLDASAAVEALLRAGTARDALAADAVAVPHLADAEIAQTLRRLAARGTISSSVAGDALDRWAHLGILRFASTALLTRVWDLRDNLSAYDATYVALAERLECPLLTADAQLSRALGLRCAVRLVVRSG